MNVKNFPKITWINADKHNYFLLVILYKIVLMQGYILQPIK